MLPFEQMPLETLATARAVLTDIDDTLTTDGRLTATAYAALERLAEAGLAVVPVTGRPAGWCDHIARMWPVAGVVGENGALYLRYDRAARRMHRRHALDARERAAARERLDALAVRILEAVPGTALASDQPYRDTDLAIDFCEDVPPLGRGCVDRIVALFEEAGATAKISSIHVNGWFGAFDKLTTARALGGDWLGLDLDRERERVIYLGDSPNDAPMFAHFPNAVGVANVVDFVDRIEHLPAYVARGRSGEGFTEVAERVLAARAGS